MENFSKVIRQLKILFAHHGIPCNNGPQFAFRQFAKFAQSFGFATRPAALDTHKEMMKMNEP